MTDDRSLAVQAVSLKVLADMVAERQREVKSDLAESMVQGDRKSARLANGESVGSVTFTNGSPVARVVDERALVAWVTAMYPEEVETQIRPAFREAILKASAGAGMPMCPDGTADVPGIELGHSTPYLTVRPDKAKLPLLMDALRANALLAIEGDT